MVVLSDPRWLQGYFSTLVGLFDRVSLKTNVGKTEGMVCHPFQAERTQSEAAYGSGPFVLGEAEGSDPVQ